MANLAQGTEGRAREWGKIQRGKKRVEITTTATSPESLHGLHGLRKKQSEASLPKPDSQGCQAAPPSPTSGLGTAEPHRGGLHALTDGRTRQRKGNAIQSCGPHKVPFMVSCQTTLLSSLGLLGHEHLPGMSDRRG